MQHEKNTEMKVLSVVFRGKEYPLELPRGEETTFDELQHAISSSAGVAVDSQRLFAQRKLLQAPGDTPIGNIDDLQAQSLIYLMAGASTADIEEMKQEQIAAEHEARIR